MMQRHSTLHVSLNMHLYTNYLKKMRLKYMYLHVKHSGCLFGLSYRGIYVTRLLLCI